MRQQLNEAKLHGHMEFQGLDISIEIPAGGKRTGVNKLTGEKWEQPIADHYGYIKGTHSPDGEHLDCYVRKNPDKNAKVYVIHQLSVDGSKYDEDKVMLGYSSKNEAVKSFKDVTFKPKEMFGGVTEFTLDHFKVVAYQAKKSSAILTTEETYNEFLEKGLLNKKIKSPVSVAKKVSEGINLDLSEVCEELDLNLVEYSLNACGLNEGEDFISIIPHAHKIYNEKSSSLYGKTISEEEFREEALKYLIERDNESSNLEVLMPEDLGNCPYLEYPNAFDLVNAYDLANKNEVICLMSDNKIYFRDPDEFEYFLDLLDQDKKELAGHMKDNIFPEPVIEEPVQEIPAEDNGEKAFVVVAIIQGMRNAGSEYSPVLIPTQLRGQTISEGLTYREAQKVLDESLKGVHKPSLNEHEYVVGLEVMESSKFSFMYGKEQTRKPTMNESELEKLKSLAGISETTEVAEGVGSVHDTLNKLREIEKASVATEKEYVIEKEHLEKAAKLTEMTALKYDNHSLDKIARAVAKKLFDNVDYGTEIINFLKENSDVSEIVRVNDRHEARLVLDRMVMNKLIKYKVAGPNELNIIGTERLVNRAKEMIRGL